jgi:hypothetical protein
MQTRIPRDFKGVQARIPLFSGLAPTPESKSLDGSWNRPETAPTSKGKPWNQLNTLFMGVWTVEHLDAGCILKRSRGHKMQVEYDYLYEGTLNYKEGLNKTKKHVAKVRAKGAHGKCRRQACRESNKM